MKFGVRSEQKRNHIASVRSTTFGVGPNSLSFRRNTTVYKRLDQYEWVSRGYRMQFWGYVRRGLWVPFARVPSTRRGSPGLLSDVKLGQISWGHSLPYSVEVYNSWIVHSHPPLSPSFRFQRVTLKHDGTFTILFVNGSILCSVQM